MIQSDSANSFARDALATSGFKGFANLSNLATELVPRDPGVYVALTSRNPAEFLEKSPAGWFKGKNPTALLSDLRTKWVDGAEVIYIGKARNLRTRLRQYRDHGSGKPVGHWGGRYIWQLRDAAGLLVAWKSHPEPAAEEQRLIAEFKARYGVRPFANLTG